MAKEDEEMKINHNNHKMLNTILSVDKRYAMDNDNSKEKSEVPEYVSQETSLHNIVNKLAIDF